MRTHHAAPPGTGTLLGVWAHPDDEAFLSAGLMARARAAGERVLVATATFGERGTSDPQRWPPERLGPLREQELAHSLEILGVSEHRWLGHRDGELAGVRRRVGRTQVTDLIDEVRPDTVVTFGPDGLTGHDDHRAVSGWVTDAWRRTGRAGRLWFATLTPSFHRVWGRLHDEAGLWVEGRRPPATGESDLAARVAFDEELARRKYAALRAHASQTDGLVTLAGEERFRRWWSQEVFVAAAETDTGARTAGGVHARR
jgi:LmbE family N-acetylglucosaminyl deacetylase